ncbi:MAG: ABC transporter permease [Gammaproteobacteria bacterium]|nr:ABC transporter permease [Gammaproteobacteria bacterium]MDH3468404.1 ABC transporter permease [Gammaproteobacteria bacterium]
MIETLYVAWRYVTYNKIKTVTLVACVTLIGVLPLALQLFLNESARQLLSRAESTPLVMGAKGSSLDLAMNTLYFDDEVPELISMAAAEEITQSDLAAPIPVYARFQARGFPIVGTSFDYFDVRGLEIEQGRSLALLGECVLGATVAERLGLKPGDSLVSSPETVFDIAGIYPLKMKVVGVLQRAYTSDDLAVFVDLKSAWVIQGLGHGHEDLARAKDPSVILDRSDRNVIANAKLVQYTEITESNLDDFHFHGDPEAYPVSAVIVIPHDVKSGTILRGRYVEQDTSYQMITPKEVIDGLLANIFRIKNVLDAVIFIVGLATVLAITLVFTLSLRLRQREIHTIFKLGCSRLTMVRLLGTEILIILLTSAALCGALVVVVNYYSHDLVRVLFIR